MINIKNKLFSIIFIIIFAILINTVVDAKYIIDNKFEVANLDIDRTKPIIELIDIKNSNVGYEKYANNTHEIDIIVKIKDENLDKVFLDKEHVKLIINNEYIEIESVQFIKLEDLQKEKKCKISLKGITGNGDLKIEFIKGTAIDTSKLENENVKFDTNIIIDNIAPKGTLQENKISDGRVQAIVNVSEEIRKLDGWKVLQNHLKLEKEFTNNISYELPIIDYAGNETIIEINITQATYIELIYASHNSEIGWTFGYGNYDIAGKEAIKRDARFKTEALAFNFSGNIDSNFIQANTYIYTHWGEDSFAESTDGIKYKYGYNPNKNEYKSMESSDLVILEGKKYFQFGGGGINSFGSTDINGNNPIPSELTCYYPYGISGISITLKDYSYYSIVYQILVDEVGWVEACSDGQECMYRNEKPMSAFRVALIPKSEKKYLLDTWNKDVGTYNLNK